MTHTGPIHESEGVFTAARHVIRRCDKCNTETKHQERTWESSDGAYEDYKYTCTECGTVHWVDGIDS